MSATQPTLHDAIFQNRFNINNNVVYTAHEVTYADFAKEILLVLKYPDGCSVRDIFMTIFLNARLWFVCRLHVLHLGLRGCRINTVDRNTFMEAPRQELISNIGDALC
jgi:hypothetical protein